MPQTRSLGRIWASGGADGLWPRRRAWALILGLSLTAWGLAGLLVLP